MSIELIVIDAETNAEALAIVAAVEDSSRWDAPMTEALTSFLDDLLAEFPVPDEGSDAVTAWSNDPRHGSMVDGRCCAMFMSARLADEMYEQIVSSCHERGLHLYSDGVFITPDGESPASSPLAKRRWWKRPSPDWTLTARS